MKKAIILMFLVVSCLLYSSYSEAVSTKQNQIEQEASNAVDEVFLYFHNLGTKKLIDEERQKLLFTPDFQMITNDVIITKDRSELTPHFEEIMAQAPRIDLILQDKIVANDTCVMKYTLIKQGKNECKVIAIFKFKRDADGILKTYLMDEVVVRQPLAKVTT